MYQYWNPNQRRQKWEIAPCVLSQKLQSKRGKKHIYTCSVRLNVVRYALG